LTTAKRGSATKPSLGDPKQALSKSDRFQPEDTKWLRGQYLPLAACTPRRNGFLLKHPENPDFGRFDLADSSVLSTQTGLLEGLPPKGS
jgi:hypothetical protein